MQNVLLNVCLIRFLEFHRLLRQNHSFNHKFSMTILKGRTSDATHERLSNPDAISQLHGAATLRALDAAVS